VVFDEAAQVPLAFAPCAMAVGARFLFVGDHRQMGPIMLGDHDDPLARASVFEYLADAYPPAFLDTTYRMNQGINAFPSRAFYGARLVPHPSARDREFPRVEGGAFDEVLDPRVAAVLVTIHHEGFRTRSAPEARAVADLAAEMLTRQRLPPGDLAVVAPYRQQVREIRTLLHRALDPLRIPLPVVDTVERIQGQEREAVIVSLTASDPEHLSGEQAAFFFSPNRLNVTLTRARTKLVVFASGHLFRAFPPSFEELRNADLFKRLYRELPRVDLSPRYL
jgi:DNA replication ATP-dependent helicase Dna2